MSNDHNILHDELESNGRGPWRDAAGVERFFPALGVGEVSYDPDNKVAADQLNALTRASGVASTDVRAYFLQNEWRAIVGSNPQDRESAAGVGADTGLWARTASIVDAGIGGYADFWEPERINRRAGGLSDAPITKDEHQRARQVLAVLVDSLLEIDFSEGNNNTMLTALVDTAVMSNAQSAELQGSGANRIPRANEIEWRAPTAGDVETARAISGSVQERG